MAKYSSRSAYLLKFLPILKDSFLITDFEDNNATKTVEFEKVLDLFIDAIINGSNALSQNNKFRFVTTTITIGGPSTELPVGDLYEQEIISKLNVNFQSINLQVLSDQLIIFKVHVVDYGTFKTHERKYFFPNLIGKGDYSPLSDWINANDIEIAYIQSAQITATPDIIVSSPNNVVFDLGDITGQDYLQYINEYPNTSLPYGYDLTNSSKIYYFRFIDNDITYLYYFDSANSLNGFGYYGVDGDFIFQPGELVLFYQSDVPNTPIPVIGVSQLVDLTDVSIVTLTDGQVIAWNATTSKWENVTVGGLTPQGIDDVLGIDNVAIDKIIELDTADPLGATSASTPNFFQVREKDGGRVTSMSSRFSRFNANSSEYAIDLQDAAEAVPVAEQRFLKAPILSADETIATEEWTQPKLDLKADLVGGIVPSAQLPPTVDEILEYANVASFPATGVSNFYYLALDTNKTYRWSGSSYTPINEGIALGETSSTAYRGDRGKVAYDHSQATGNPHGTSKSDVGLSNVDNTSDVNKPVSTAQATAIGLKEDSINKSTSTADSASSTKFPVWSAIVSYFSNSRIKTLLGQASSTIDGWLSSADWNTFNNKQNALGFTPENNANRGIANGYVPTNSSNKIDLVYLPDAILGQVVYGGMVDISTMIATLTNNAKSKLGTSSSTITLTNNSTAITGYVSNEGIYYITSVGGTFAGIPLDAGDWLISIGSAWKKVDNTDAISSFNSRTGAITLTSSDVTGAIGFTPVASNSAITGATKTKVTYDSKGLVTGGTDATTDDIQESGTPTNKWWTNARTIAATLTSYVKGSGTISSSDTTISAIQKLDGNVDLKQDKSVQIKLSSTYTLTNQTALQKLFNTGGGASNDGSFDVVAGEKYEFETQFSLTSLSATSSNMQFGLLGTATLSAVEYVAFGSKNNPTGNSTPNFNKFTVATASVISASTGFTSGFARVKGTFTASTSGTVYLSYGMSVGSAAIVDATSTATLKKIL